MSIDIGIIGLPQSGKTTVFHGLTRGRVDATSHTTKGLAPHIGIATVPDPRLQTLANILHPQKLVSAEAKYLDIGASVKSLVDEKGIGGQLLNQLSAVDALIIVIRAFTDESIPHPEGSINVERDITAMDMELTFSDLAIIERRLQRIEISLKGGTPIERQHLLQEKELDNKLKAELEREIPIREVKLNLDETRAIANYQFLTAKPLIIVINIGEDQLGQIEKLEAELKKRYAQPKRGIIAMCGKLEMELTQLGDSAVKEFQEGYGIKELGLDRIIRLSYQLLGLVTFFSIASGEVRAWPIVKGTSAVKAAGKIHTDMERGFIRAEVISFNDLLKCGSIAEAKKQGLLRLEGKNYTVEDGDIITFLFNV